MNPDAADDALAEDLAQLVESLFGACGRSEEDKRDRSRDGGSDQAGRFWVVEVREARRERLVGRARSG